MAAEQKDEVELAAPAPAEKGAEDDAEEPKEEQKILELGQN